jgi:hypothetical protein
MAEFSKYLLEQSFSRLLNHTQNRNIGLISAARGDLSPAENNHRHAQLKDDLRKSNLGYVRVSGAYTENKGEPNERHVKEKSLLVIGKEGHDNGHLLGTLKNLGKKYGQDSILHKSHEQKTAQLHGTNDSPFPGKDKSVDVGEWHPNRAGEFHSLLKGKPSKPFQFGEQVLFDPNVVYEDYTFWAGRSWFNRVDHLF